MSKQPTAFYAPYKRKSLPLTGTVAKVQISLCHRTQPQLIRATADISKATGLTVAASAVARRAISRYSAYLAGLAPAELASECGSVRDASKAHTDVEAYEASMRVLNEPPIDGVQLPSLDGVLTPPKPAYDHTAFMAQADLLYEQVMSSRRKRGSAAAKRKEVPHGPK